MGAKTPILRADHSSQRGPIRVEQWTLHEPWQRATCHSALVTHDYATLAFHLHGVSHIEQGGTTSRVQGGEVLILPAGHPHRTLAATPGTVLGVGFCPACFSAAEHARLLEPFARVRAGAAAVAAIPTPRQAVLHSHLTELAAAVARTDPGAEVVQRSLLTLVLDEVLRAASPLWGAAAPGDSLVAEALRLIEQRCLGPLSLDEVAAAVRRSPAHVTTTVRQATGRSVHAWIVAGRMGEARRRLLHSDEQVEIIGERVGYPDPTHFIRTFRRHHGDQTPAAWRRARRGEALSAPPPAPS